MDKTILLNNLYDYYKELFTEKQRECFEKYYFENLSLSEIAEELKISRNAIHNQVQTVEDKLYYYEKNLSMLERRKKVLKKVENLLDNDTIEDIKEIL